MSSYVGASVGYVFNPTAGTINFSSQPGFNPAFVKAITDQTQNAFIYLPGVTGFGGTWNSTGQVLTLQATVSGYSSTDILLIQYDDQSDALSNIQNLLGGVNTQNYQPQMRIPGATVQSPNMQDAMRSLQAEMRLNTLVYCMLAREEIDLEALKRSIYDEMQS